MKKNLVLVMILTVVILIVFFLTSPSFRFDRFGEVETEWVDFIKVDGKMYHIEYIKIGDKLEKVVVDKSNIGKEIGKVKLRLADNVRGEYRIRDWDAGYLEKGTRILSLLDQKNKDSIVVEVEGEYYLYSTISD